MMTSNNPLVIPYLHEYDIVCVELIVKVHLNFNIPDSALNIIRFVLLTFSFFSSKCSILCHWASNLCKKANIVMAEGTSVRIASAQVGALKGFAGQSQ